MMQRMQRGRKRALVLSGGGARGLAHIGALQEFEAAGIRFDLIVGCSFGGLIGAAYAQDPNAMRILQKFRDALGDPRIARLNNSSLKDHYEVEKPGAFRKTLKTLRSWVMLNYMAARQSVVSHELLEILLARVLRPGDIRDTVIPYACNATDLVHGEGFLFNEGDIQRALLASMSVPGYFPPVAHQGRLLVDGAVTYNLPVRFARELGAEEVVAIDVHPKLHHMNSFSSIFDIIVRAKMITGNILSREHLYSGDILIRPEVADLHWYEFHHFDRIVAEGRRAAREVLNGQSQPSQPAAAPAASLAAPSIA
ncbi:MAG TPA: patatin-like phospholipase family protein [Calditrichia bacterium]|nr:patatin-like phospholipase family protein [Calditrichia bacterium]